MKPISGSYYVIQPNLGLGYLATVMLNSGHEVSILDSGKEKLTWDKFSGLVRKERYDLIGIQMFTHEFPSVKKHLEVIKNESPDTVIILGGAHISGDPQDTMNILEEADFGFIGEAEIGIAKFMRLKKEDYLNYELLGNIPNLVWRRSGNVIVNRREIHHDLNKIQFPSFHLMPITDYPIAPHGSLYRKTPIAPLIISRGCPFDCTYCAGKLITGRAIRYRSVDNVLKEIILLHSKYGVKEIHIEDDNFTLKKDYVIELCNALIKLKLDVAFALPNGVRLDTLDEEVLKSMEKAGFYSFAVGIESGSDRVLRLMNKGLTTKIISEKIKLIKKCTKLKLTGFFLIGYPGETEEEILKTISFAKYLKLDRASFMFAMPLPGTDLEGIYKKNNRKNVCWDKFFYYRLVDGLSDIPRERLVRLYKKAILEFYLRPKIMFGLLGELKTFSQVKIIAQRAADIFVKN